MPSLLILVNRSAVLIVCTEKGRTGQCHGRARWTAKALGDFDPGCDLSLAVAPVQSGGHREALVQGQMQVQGQRLFCGLLQAGGDPAVALSLPLSEAFNWGAHVGPVCSLARTLTAHRLLE